MNKLQFSGKGNIIFLIKISVCIMIFFCFNSIYNEVHSAPPYSGTIFNFPNSFLDTDPTTFTGVAYRGQESRRVYDRRSGYITINAYVYIASFSDGCPPYEMIVNPEFSQSQAQELAEKYARNIGQMPICVRTGITGAVIHDGVNPWGGGDPLTIHHGQGLDYESRGIVTETMIHEATHASFDYRYYTPDWYAAASSDGEYISTSARDYPDREDHSETFLCWLAARYKQDRISSGDYTTITTTIPNRLQWYDNMNFELGPISGADTPEPTPSAVMGDVNKSGTINIVDALLVAQYYVGLNPSNFEITVSDVDCSKATNIVDALLIAQFYVGLITLFPC